MAWIYLFLAGLFEVAWAIGLKLSHGYARPWALLATILLMAVSFVLLSLALRELPLGTAYTIWTGIGAVGTVACGILLFGESTDLPRLFCIALIVIGITGLKLVTTP